MIREEVLIRAEELADLQRGGEILDAEGRSVMWDQEHADELMSNLVGPLQIPWMYSRKCIFSCRHCYNVSTPAYDEAGDCEPKLIADRIIECMPYNICLCGGEPFAWDSFYGTVKRLADGGIPMISVVSNGYLVTRDALLQAQESGLTAVQFSVDGLDAETHGQLRVEPQSFDRVVNAIRAALELEWYDLSIAMTPTRQNVQDVRNYVRKFAAMGVNHVRFQPYMPLGRGALNAPELRPTDQQYLRFHLDLREAQLEHPEIFVDWGDPLEHIWFYAFTEANCWSTGVSTDGWMELSPYLPLLLGDLKQHAIKDAWAKGIKAMWHSPLVRRLAGHVYCLDALATQEINAYFEEPLYVDIFDERQWEALMTTDDLDVFRGFSRANRTRMES